jgi:hypothetical protein
MSQTFETLSLEQQQQQHHHHHHQSDDDDDLVEPHSKKQKLNHLATDNTVPTLAHLAHNDDGHHQHLSSSIDMDASNEATTVDDDDDETLTHDDDDDDELILCEIEADVAAQCALLDQVEAYYDQEDTLVECFYLQAVEELRFSQSNFA